jgi:hypothetical protein
MSNEGITDTLFVAMFTDNENERRVACNKLILECTRRGWHPTEVKLLYGNNLLERQHRMLEELTTSRDKLVEQNSSLKKEVEALRKHASPQIRRRVRESVSSHGRKGLFSIVTETLYAGRPPGRYWRVELARYIGRSQTEIKEWEKPGAAVPEAILDQLRSASPLPMTPRRKRPKNARKIQTKKETVSKDSGSEVSPTEPRLL